MQRRKVGQELTIWLQKSYLFNGCEDSMMTSRKILLIKENAGNSVLNEQPYHMDSSTENNRNLGNCNYTV